MLITTEEGGIYAAHFTHGVVEYLRWRCICGARSATLSVAIRRGAPVDPIDAGEKTSADHEFDALWDSHVEASLALDPESKHTDTLWDRWMRRATWATVHRGRCEPKRPCTHAEAVTARVECSVDDRFEKAKGRKLALGRALIETTFPKEERAAIWKAYRRGPTWTIA